MSAVSHSTHVGRSGQYTNVVGPSNLSALGKFSSHGERDKWSRLLYNRKFFLISAESAPWLVRLRIFCLRDQRKVPGANRLKVGPATTNDDQQGQHTSIVPKSQ